MLCVPGLYPLNLEPQALADDEATLHVEGNSNNDFTKSQRGDRINARFVLDWGHRG